MSLSPDEKALVEAIYTRLRYWRKGWGSWVRVILAGVFVENAFLLVQTLHNSGTHSLSAVILAFMLGSSMSLSIFAVFAQGSLMRRDEILIRFFENRFPSECSWKQEESILAEAEETRIKAATALRPTGTTRSLLPLPITLMKPASKCKCALVPSSSLRTGADRRYIRVSPPVRFAHPDNELSGPPESIKTFPQEFFPRLSLKTAPSGWPDWPPSPPACPWPRPARRRRPPPGRDQ